MSKKDAVPAAPAAVVVNVAQAVNNLMAAPLSFDNITDFLCEVGGAVDSIGKAYHYGMTFLISEFGHKAVFGINGNRCKGNTPEAKEASKAKHAVELDLTPADFKRLFEVFEAVNKRRSDCWRQAKACYTNVEKAKQDATTVATIDKPESMLSMEIELEEKKAQVAVAQADKKRADLNLARAKLDGEPTAELEQYAKEAKAEFEALEAERARIAQELKNEREKAKKDADWTAYSAKVEALAKWCKEREEYKDVAKRVLELLLV